MNNNSNSNLIDAFLRRLGFLVNFVGLICLLLFGFYAIFRIPCNWKLRANATCERERQYFELVLYGCYSGAYSFVVTMLTFVSEDGFGLYWPTISGIWTSHGGIGQIGHSNTVIGDAFLSLVLCGLFLWRASTLGTSKIACDGSEIFFGK